MTAAELSGTIVPLVTPFTADGGIDRSGLEALIRFLQDEDADGLMPTALTGEGPLLSESETLEVWDATFALVDGARPVIPAIISFTTSLFTPPLQTPATSPIEFRSSAARRRRHSSRSRSDARRGSPGSSTSSPGPRRPSCLLRPTPTRRRCDGNDAQPNRGDQSRASGSWRPRGSASSSRSGPARRRRDGTTAHTRAHSRGKLS